MVIDDENMLKILFLFGMSCTVGTGDVLVLFLIKIFKMLFDFLLSSKSVLTEELGQGDQRKKVLDE